MANTNLVEISLNTKLLDTQVKAVSNSLAGLDRVLTSIASGVREAFAVKGFEDYKDTVTRFGKDLADELLVLQLAFGRMKYAIAEAVAPIASVFVPMLNSAIQAVIRFAGVVRQFLSGILAGITGRKELAAAAEDATYSETKLGSAAKSTAKAVKRSLASFDQLERLSQSSSGGSGGSGGSVDLWGGFTQDPISPQVQAVVDQILRLLAPLMAIDLEPLKLSLQGVWSAFSQLATVLGEAMGFLWYEILTPFAAWVMEKLAPAFADGIAAKLQMVATALEPVIAGLELLWQEVLQPVAEFIGQNVIMVLENWKNAYIRLTAVFQEKTPVITTIFQNIAQMASSMWAVVQPVLSNLSSRFSDTFSGISQLVAGTVGFLLDALSGLTGFLAGAFSGDWKQAWEGIRSFLRTVVNGVITLLNGMVSRLVSALNAVIRTVNGLSFTVPSWVPAIGGRQFGFNMRTLSAPQIPYLAKGAVLPAGKPFLAVVGDQKHGTNVEAPLSTIQEAVALVMDDQTAALLHGLEATVRVQQQILEAVLGISIGDEVIGTAAQRYNRRMAVIQGGIG